MAFLDQLNPQLSLADLLSGGGGQSPQFRPPGMLPPTYQGGGGIVPPIGQGGGFGDQRLSGILPPTPAPGAPPFRPPDFNPVSPGTGLTGKGTPPFGGPPVPQPGTGMTGVQGVPPAPKPITPAPMQTPGTGTTGFNGASGTGLTGKPAPPFGGPPVKQPGTGITGPGIAAGGLKKKPGLY